MKSIIFNALVKKYEAIIEENRATLEIYFNNPAISENILVLLKRWINSLRTWNLLRVDWKHLWITLTIIGQQNNFSFSLDTKKFFYIFVRLLKKTVVFIYYLRKKGKNIWRIRKKFLIFVKSSLKY